MKAKIAVLPGDGIGPEVVAEGVKVLKQIERIYHHDFTFEEALVGGIAIEQTGVPLPQQSLQLCHDSDAVLLGAVGGPKWDDPRARVRPEQGLLGLRRELGLFANLRFVKPFEELLHASTVKPEVIRGVDLIVVRELIGGLYFGEPSGRTWNNGHEQAVNTMIYCVPEVERIAHIAFQLARQRRCKVTSVDKANVLAVSRLWREVAMRVAEAYDDVEYESLLVDSCAMFLVTCPTEFDVIVTGNMFGDILTDEAAALVGSLGMLPSASLGNGSPGLYEPIHGSAPDLAGQGVANPIATILSGAMLLRYTLNSSNEATAVEEAVQGVLADGWRTRDIMEEGKKCVGTEEMGDLIARKLKENSSEVVRERSTTVQKLGQSRM